MAADPSPTKELIISTRLAAGLTPEQAGSLIATPQHKWLRWESGDATMHPTLWELFLVRMVQGKTVQAHDLDTSHALEMVRSALKGLLDTGGAIAEAADADLVAAIQDGRTSEIIKDQAAAVLRARKALNVTQRTVKAGAAQKRVDDAVEAGAKQPVARWRDLCDGESICASDRILAAGRQWSLVGEGSHLVGKTFDQLDSYPVQRPVAPVSEQDAVLLNQAIELLQEHAEEQGRAGNCSVAQGAICSADAVQRIAVGVIRNN